MTRIEQKAMKLMEAQGFFIVAFHAGPLPMPNPGEVWREAVENKLPPPFLCIGHASKQEYLSQREILGTDEQTMSHLRRNADRAIGFLKLVSE